MMYQIFRTLNRRVPDDQHRRIDFPKSRAARPFEGPTEPIQMRWPSTLSPIPSDWFALRIWEDDGGGHTNEISFP